MKRLFCVLLTLLLLSGCSSKPVQQQFFAMDTVMSVTAYGKEAQNAVTAAVARINELEGLLSRTRTGSEVTKLYLSAPEPVTLSEDTLRVLTLAQEWHAKTGGAFDATIAPVTTAWGFGGSGAYQVPSPEKLEELLAMVNGTSVVLTETTAALPVKGMELDLGGIAKGYAAAQAEQVLRAAGVEHALLDLGGNITVIGDKPDGGDWRIGVQDPTDRSGTVGILSLRDCSAVTSGGYQRYFEHNGIRYHHILNAKTGKNEQNGIASATVVADESTDADALSTILFLKGEDALELCSQCGADAIIIKENGETVTTNGFEEKYNYEKF